MGKSKKPHSPNEGQLQQQGTGAFSPVTTHASKFKDAFMQVRQTPAPTAKDTGPSNTTPPAEEPPREQKEPPSTDKWGADEHNEPDPVIHPTSLPKETKEPISTAPVKDKFDLGDLEKNPFFHLGRGDDDDEEGDDNGEGYDQYRRDLYEGMQDPPDPNLPDNPTDPMAA